MICSPENFISFPDNSIFLVTGASSGIGAAIALCLNSLGACVIASGRDKEKLLTIREQCRNPEYFHCETRDLLVDLTNLPHWVQSLREKYGPFSGLVCAAGQTMTMPFMQFDYADATRMFDLLYHAPMLLTRAACQRQNHVKDNFNIVFIAAAASVMPNIGQTVYASAKAALVCACKCMAKELAKKNIRLNCISPGLVKTAMLDKTVELLGDSFLKNESSLYPLGLGESEDVAAMTAFLLSSATRWVTGQNIVLDGGRLL